MRNEQADVEMVSARYRQLAGERTPAHLDQKILQLAASHASRTDYARSINWTRPLAWAATIALCLAVTLELSRVPAPEEVANRPESKSFPATAYTDADQPLAEKSAVVPEQPAAVGLARKVESDAAIVDTSSDERQRPASARYQGVEDVAAAAPAFELSSKDAQLVRQAEEMARLQTGTNAEQRAISSRCTDEVRAEPESWLECIEALEEIGDHEAALVERESLVAVFPDFKLP